MAKPKLTNVRKHLEWEIEFISSMLEDNDKYSLRLGHGGRGLFLPPLYVHELEHLKFFAQAILRKHAAKNTRKDIYVEAK